MTYCSLEAVGITAVKWKLDFLNEVKLCDIWSNPLPGIYHLLVLFNILFQKLKTNGKRKICKYWICDRRKPCTHQRGPFGLKASTGCDGQSLYFHLSLSEFTMILLPLGFKTNLIFILTIFHYQVIKSPLKIKSLEEAAFCALL